MAIPSPSISAAPTPQPIASSPTPSGAESLAEAQRYLDTRDFAKALPLLQKVADAGNTEAMLHLDWLYEFGTTGVAKDYGKAREYYQKAANAGNTGTMYRLGWLYEDGKGGAKDDGKAREWYQKAADAGDTNAKEALARLNSTSTSQPTTPNPTPSRRRLPKRNAT
jgi:TPR repeat protein